MKYYQFTKSIKANVTESIRCHLQLIEKTEEGKVLVNGIETEFKTLEEARRHIKEEHIAKKLEQEVSKDLYENLSDNTVAHIIKEYHDVKVTDTLIENYISLASSKIFTIDPVVQEIRKLNKLDSLVENKLHYVLNDDSIVAISERKQSFLNNLLQDQTDIIEYMRESKENFFYVLEQIEE